MNIFQSLLSRQALANFGLIATVLILNAIAVHRNGVALHERHSLVVHTLDVLTRADQLFIMLVDAESGVRGFAITGDDAYLETYQHAVEGLHAQLRGLRENVPEKSIQSAKTQEMEIQAIGRMEHLRRVIQARKDEGFEAARDIIENGEGTLAMNRIRDVIKNLKIEEKQILRDRKADADHNLFTILFANIAGACLSLVITCVAWRLIDRQMRICRDAELKADAERENLLVTLTSIGDAVVVTDATGRIRLSNPVANELLGATEEIVGKPLSDVFTLVNQSSARPLKNPVSSILELQTVTGVSDQSLLLRPDGKQLSVEHSAALIRNKTGQITGVVLVFRDCSERWRVEKELLKREHRFRKMFETPLLGIAVGTSDGRALLEANDAYLDLIGYDRGELLESSLGWGGVIAEQSPLDEAAQLELQETGVCRPFEKVYTRTDGTIVPVLISSTKLFDDEDGIIVFITDLTRAKRSEAALRDSEDRFRILSESMPQMVWMALPDGGFDYINHTMVEYSGRTVEELSGWGWTELLHDEERERLIAGWKSALTTGQPLEIEYRLRQSTGDFRWYLTRARPMYGASGQITRWVGTNTDIHDHKQVESMLKDEHQRKDRFLALLAHELRNPLAPLANAVQVFGSVRKDPIRSTELIAIMQRQIKQMTRLIDDLLDIARITQDRVVLRRERMTVSSAMAAAVEAVQPWINERSHLFTVQVPAEPLWIDADPARLSQILTNLLQNAAKYTEPQGRIEFSAESVDGDVLFRIRDNGPGLSEKLLASIFNQFMHVDESLIRSHNGLGIGLKLVHAFVELHGGKVSAHSQGLGHGSEFIVRLPLIAEEISTAPNPPSMPREDPAKFSSMKVLIVDDVKASAKTLALMVSVLGPKVETAFDGMTAVDKATNGTFDIIFLDIAMPGMDGLEVARQLRAVPRLKKLWLVALTGFGQSDDRQRSIDAGFNEHIIKPANMALLSEVLQNAAISINRQDLKPTEVRHKV